MRIWKAATVPAALIVVALAGCSSEPTQEELTAVADAQQQAVLTTGRSLATAIMTADPGADLETATDVALRTFGPEPTMSFVRDKDGITIYSTHDSRIAACVQLTGKPPPVVAGTC